MTARAHRIEYHFRGHDLFPPVGSGAGSPFASKVTASGGGSPTIIGASGGLALNLGGPVVGVENLSIYQGDILPWDIDDLIRVEFVVKAVAALDSNTQIAFGLISARNDTIDTIAEAALFRLIGSNDVVVESDDGTNNNDDVATGITLGSTFKRFAIDFATGIQTREPPLLSLGGKSNVQFYGGNANGSLRRVAYNSAFDMSNYSGGLQLFAQIQKASDNNSDSFTILEIDVEVKMPNA